MPKNKTAKKTATSTAHIGFEAKRYVQPEKFVEAHGSKLDDAPIWGQESHLTTHRLGNIDLALSGNEASFREKPADIFRNDLHPDFRADLTSANSPFNDSDWHRKEIDVRWQYVPPRGSANFDSVQQAIHLFASDGIAGSVLANGSISPNQSAKGEIRTNPTPSLPCVTPCCETYLRDNERSQI